MASREDGDPVDDLRAWRSHIDFGLPTLTFTSCSAPPDASHGRPLPPRAPACREARVRRLAESGLLAVPEPQAVGLIHAAGTGAVLALLQQPVESRDTSLADTMFEAVIRAILTRTPALSASNLVPLAIAFRTAVPHRPGLTEGERQLLAEWLDRTIAETPTVPPAAS